jgi:hypothetical protein
MHRDRWRLQEVTERLSACYSSVASPSSLLDLPVRFSHCRVQEEEAKAALESKRTEIEPEPFRPRGHHHHTSTDSAPPFLLQPLEDAYSSVATTASGTPATDGDTAAPPYHQVHHPSSIFLLFLPIIHESCHPPPSCLLFLQLTQRSINSESSLLPLGESGSGRTEDEHLTQHGGERQDGDTTRIRCE